MCPDWESSQQPLGSQASSQSTEPHQPGQMFSFISVCIAFISNFILWPSSIISVGILITSVLNSASDRLSRSSSLSFFWSCDLFFHLGHISLSRWTCYVVRGQALGIHQGGTTHLAALWHCLSGRDQRENNDRRSLCSSPLSNELSCETWSFSHFHNPHSILQLEALSL